MNNYLLGKMSSNELDMVSIPSPSPSGYTIYSKSGCIYCERAKELLRYEETVVVDCDPFLLIDKEWFRKTMRVHCRQDYRMFPMIFYRGAFIGGYSEAKDYYQGKLADALEEF